MVTILEQDDLETVKILNEKGAEKSAIDTLAKPSPMTH